MKKQLNVLYILLFVILVILGWSLYLLFSINTEPEIPEDFLEYAQQQEQVFVQKRPQDDVPESTQEDDQENEGIYLSFDSEALKEENPDFAGWLMLPDTNISYPVVMAPDYDYYLYRGFDREYNPYGCLFFDMASVPGADNRVIYGHNMGIECTEMFSPLLAFQEQEYAAAHPYAYFAKSEKEPADVYELYAVVNFDLLVNLDFDYAQSNFLDPESREAFISYLQERSIFKTDFIPEGQLLILSTCNRQYSGGNRLIVCYGKPEADPVLLNCIDET